MTDNNIELTRRKVLASMGAVGAAGAGAGVGTTALFSDEESFENNSLTAGTLDLKMDWEEHYSYPQIYDGFEDPTTAVNSDGETVELDVVRSEPDAEGYVGLPDPENPTVWANDTDDPLGDGRSSLDVYFQNTIIEAFPDEGSTDPRGTFTFIDEDGAPRVQNACETLGDLPSALGTYSTDTDGEVDHDNNPARTRNPDTYDAETGEPNDLLSLNDVKPGDYGEFTFSAHICGNDGYLWLQMPDGLSNDENSVTEPEAEAENESSEDLANPNTTPDQDGDIDGEGELAQNVQTALWYDDNCNNRIDGEPEDLVALAVIDTSDSVLDSLSDIVDAANRFVEQLNTQVSSEVSVYAGILTLEDTGDTNNVIVAKEVSPVSEYVDSNGDGVFGTGSLLPPADAVGGNSPLPHALDLGREYLNNEADRLEGNGSVTDPQRSILLLSDGAPGYSDGTGELVESDGSQFSDVQSNTYESDYFDGLANDTTVAIPEDDPDLGTGGGTSRAETTLVARDIDGLAFLNGTQPAGPKIDNHSTSSVSDPADISGDNGVSIITVGIEDDSVQKDTLTAYATNKDNVFNLGVDDPAEVADAIVSSLNVVRGEDVLFRGDLLELEEELAPGPDGSGPLMLDGDRTGTADNAPFTAGAVHCFGFAWWVPEEVGNEIQSDSVSFDLGFYAEQARNNEDPGQSFSSS